MYIIISLYTFPNLKTLKNIGLRNKLRLINMKPKILKTSNSIRNYSQISDSVKQKNH